MRFAPTVGVRSIVSSLIPRAEERNEDPVISYRLLRKVVGIIGIMLPPILILGNVLIWHEGVASSISDYYYTGMRDWFVGSMWAIGVFLLSYRGPQRQDDILGDIACACALVVALFPPTPDGEPTSWVGLVHLGAAGLLFLTLAVFCLALFTITDHPRTPAKEREILFYKSCGWTMIACIGLVPVSYALVPEDFSVLGIRPVLALESIAVLAFGASWLRKGLGEGALSPETVRSSPPARA